jgi:hypothetical protein
LHLKHERSAFSGGVLTLLVSTVYYFRVLPALVECVRNGHRGKRLTFDTKEVKSLWCHDSCQASRTFARKLDVVLAFIRIYSSFILGKLRSVLRCAVRIPAEGPIVSTVDAHRSVKI